MRRAFGACAAALAGWVAPASAQLGLTEVVDGPLGLGLPKFVEITNYLDFDVDLTGYSLGVFADGSNQLLGGQAIQLGGSILPGASIVISFEDGDAPGVGVFRTVYGVDPSHFDFGAVIDGDDAIALFCCGSGPNGEATGDGSDALRIDVYGEIGIDGTGRGWEYTDGYAYRCGVTPSGQYDPVEWIRGGPDALEAGCGGDDACETANLLLLTTPFGQPCNSQLGAICFGDGTGAPCGCGNESQPDDDAGCLHGLGVGAKLEYSGGWMGNHAITTSDQLVLIASNVPAQPGLFFQANNVIGGDAGAGVTFGDGIRCCGGGVVRIEIAIGQLPQPTTVSTTVTISDLPGNSNLAGTTKCYQYWYRNPGSTPCGSGFNLSNAVEIIWL